MTKNKGKVIIELDEKELAKEGAKKKTKRVLCFSLGGESYCVDISQAKEVIRPPDMTRVPTAPPFILGIVNLRGEIISVVDIRYFLGLKEIEKTGEIRVIVTDVTGSSLGIMADGVKDTLEITEDAIQPPLATLKGKLAEYTKGQVQFGKEILIYLDLEKVLRSEEIERLRKGGF